MGIICHDFIQPGYEDSISDSTGTTLRRNKTLAKATEKRENTRSGNEKAAPAIEAITACESQGCRRVNVVYMTEFMPELTMIVTAIEALRAVGS